MPGCQGRSSRSTRRTQGATRAFRAHAPTCSTCQANLRSVVQKYGRDTLTADFLGLLRPTDAAA